MSELYLSTLEKIVNRFTVHCTYGIKKQEKNDIFIYSEWKSMLTCVITFKKASHMTYNNQKYQVFQIGVT